MWLSVLAVRPGGRAQHPPQRQPGVYGVAFADYRDRGMLPYRELLVARLVGAATIPRVSVTDAWVTSPASRDGGRSLWAIPKELADLRVTAERVGRATRTTWTARVEATSVASGTITCLAAVGPRIPFALAVAQPRGDGGATTARVTGSARIVPTRTTVRFDTDGPLAWLSGRRTIASLWLRDLRFTFGG